MRKFLERNILFTACLRVRARPRGRGRPAIHRPSLTAGLTHASGKGFVFCPRVEKSHRPRPHFQRGARIPLPVGPRAGFFQFAYNQYPLSFRQILVTGFGLPIPGRHAEPDRLVLALAVLASPRSTGGNTEVSDSHAAGRVVGWVLGELHRISCVLFPSPSSEPCVRLLSHTALNRIFPDFPFISVLSICYGSMAGFAYHQGYSSEGCHSMYPNRFCFSSRFL